MRYLSTIHPSLNLHSLNSFHQAIVPFSSSVGLGDFHLEKLCLSHVGSQPSQRPTAAPAPTPTPTGSRGHLAALLMLVVKVAHLAAVAVLTLGVMKVAEHEAAQVVSILVLVQMLEEKMEVFLHVTLRYHL